MKLFTFGDSWTEGVGGDLKEEYETNIAEERTKIRHKYCWPKWLAEYLGGIEFENNGIGACSNKTIFDAVAHNLHNNIINKDDLVIIMWSSSLRDSPPFFPSENQWHAWQELHLQKMHLYEHVFKKILTNTNDIHRDIKKQYTEYYIENIYTDVYYDIINQNYILYLQYMLEEIGVRYVFCDAFDLMIRKDIIKEVDKTNLIKKENYWGFKNITFRDFLSSTNRKDVWEDNLLWSKINPGKHPNKNGYKIIAKELYDFIICNNILNTKLKSITKKIL